MPYGSCEPAGQSRTKTHHKFLYFVRLLLPTTACAGQLRTNILPPLQVRQKPTNTHTCQQTGQSRTSPDNCKTVRWTLPGQTRTPPYKGVQLSGVCLVGCLSGEPLCFLRPSIWPACRDMASLRSYRITVISCQVGRHSLPAESGSHARASRSSRYTLEARIEA
jgi:hypothetical protein